MADERWYLKLSTAAYSGLSDPVLTVPDIWMLAFVGSLGPIEDEVGNTLLPASPAMEQMVDYLGHPGGLLRQIEDGDVLATGEVVEGDWTYLPIPSEKREVEGYTPGQLDTALKGAIAAVFEAEGVNWWERWLSATQLREQTTLQGEVG